MRKSLENKVKKKKIALFIPTMNMGGAERVASILANGFVKKGLAVDMVLVRAVGPYLGDLDPAVNVVDLGAKRTFFALPKLIKYLKRKKPHALLAFMPHPSVAALLAREISFSNTRIILSEHTSSKTQMENLGISLKERFMWLLAKILYKKAHKITAVSSGAADELATLIKVPLKKIQVIYNPVLLDRIVKSSLEQPEHPWFSENIPIFIAMGRLVEQKDYPTLIRAFAIVAEKIQARLIILGEGHLRKELEKQIREYNLEDKISLPGQVNNPWSYIKRARLFILSSIIEGFPNALVEAMACGIPVISTDCPSGPREILEGGKWGKLVPVGDYRALAHGILEECEKSEKRDITERAQAFDLEIILDEYLKALIH